MITISASCDSCFWHWLATAINVHGTVWYTWIVPTFLHTLAFNMLLQEGLSTFQLVCTCTFSFLNTLSVCKWSCVKRFQMWDESKFWTDDKCHSTSREPSFYSPSQMAHEEQVQREAEIVEWGIVADRLNRRSSPCLWMKFRQGPFMASML